MDRPGARLGEVAAIAGLVAIHGLLALAQALVGLGQPGGPFAFLLSALVALVLLYLAFGIWTREPWAWLTTLMVEGIDGFFALVSVILVPGAVGAWLTLVLAGAISFLLTRPGVRGAFHRFPVR